MDDCLIIGGGVIGLSLAYELAGQGWRVRVIDRAAAGSEASWAGAGILPPGSPWPSDRLSPYDQLCALSSQLHGAWAEQLRAETGVDNGYLPCGGIYATRAGAETLVEAMEAWRAIGIEVRALSREDLPECEPALADPRVVPAIEAAYLLPGESQLRNPRHLKALIAGCTARGVEIVPGVEVHDFERSGERIERVVTSLGTLSAANYCLASGAWSGGLLARLGRRPPMKPIRGQMLLLADRPGRLRHVVNEGRRYLVPRADGRVLVGSTEEEAGFVKQTTAEGVAGLLQFALSLVPSLAGATLERTWAGLRPGTADGLPYLGRVPEWANLFVAAGHFRSGLHLSTGTAVAMGQLMRGETPTIELSPFGLDRDANAGG